MLAHECSAGWWLSAQYVVAKVLFGAPNLSHGLLVSPSVLCSWSVLPWAGGAEGTCTDGGGRGCSQFPAGTRKRLYSYCLFTGSAVFWPKITSSAGKNNHWSRTVLRNTSCWALSYYLIRFRSGFRSSVFKLLYPASCVTTSLSYQLSTLWCFVTIMRNSVHD